ncbi:hypothetical protein C8R43DRAFT_1109573 [Mycena crocata]|nr:hypothetical protein C8R43DRAFT_1109573 [Mycena crocata]
MSSSAVPHVIAFITRPLLAAFAPASVTSAQLILNASLASNATFTLTSTTAPPPSIQAASIGSGISWASWFNTLGGGRDILLFYGPGYLKVRIGNAQVMDVWSEESQGSVVPISGIQKAPAVQQSTGARLRSALLSARIRSMKRAEQQAEPIHIPSLLAPVFDSDSGSDSSYDAGSESDHSDSDCSSSTSSRFTSYSSESLTSAATSPPVTPVKAASLALPVAPSYVALPRRSQTSYRASKITRIPVDHMKKDTTAYIYQGGVTRVMTGGVLLGPRPAAHVISFTRS